MAGHFGPWRPRLNIYYYHSIYIIKRSSVCGGSLWTRELGYTVIKSQEGPTHPSRKPGQRSFGGIYGEKGLGGGPEGPKGRPRTPQGAPGSAPERPVAAKIGAEWRPEAKNSRFCRAARSRSTVEAIFRRFLSIFGFSDKRKARRTSEASKSSPQVLAHRKSNS